MELSLKVPQAAATQGKTVILDPSPVRPIPEAFYSYCSVITPNETDTRSLVGFPVVDRISAAQAAGELLAKGVNSVIIKMGKQGAYYATPGGGEQVRPFPAQAVDSVGAGDAFNGALAVALAEGKDLAQAVRIASAAGAVAVTRFGAQDSMPTREEVEGLLKTRRL
jgi:ribokinase